MSDHVNVSIAADVTPPIVFIQSMAVPVADQGQGNGRRAYEAWEAELSLEVKFVTLRAISTSEGFWAKLGFVPFGTEGVMVKAVNGSRFPEDMYAIAGMEVPK